MGDTAPGQAEDAAVVHVVYDKKTGSIIHRHTVFNVEQDAYEERRPEEVLDLALQDQEFVLDRVTDRSRDNLAVLVLKDVPQESTANLRVDARRKALVPQPRLRLTADKRELDGDGEDTATIRLEVVDEAGDLVKSFRGPVKVTTTRGKLSAPGGVVSLRQGAGEIRLTSVNETVDRVTVTARCQQRPCAADTLELEFL